MKRFKKGFLSALLAGTAVLLAGRGDMQVKAADYRVEGQKITIQAKSGEDIHDALNDALMEAKKLGENGKICTVKVPAGTYQSSDILHIYSNTTLVMDGVTLKSTENGGEKKNGSYNMLVSGSRSFNNGARGYDGYSNITLQGGTFEGAKKNAKTQIRLFHGTNVTVKDVTICGGNSNHMLEVAAINHFKVTGCTFRDMSATGSGSKREALQIDLAAHTSIYPEIVLDGTMMKNITIQNNKFINVSRGIGSHSLLQGGYVENVKITGNLFDGVEQECIAALNYYKADISRNTMKNCGAGILFQYSKGDAKTIFTTIEDGRKKYSGKVRHDAASSISNNVIQTTYHAKCDENQGIKLYGRNITKAEKNHVDGGTVPAGDYYVGGVTVSKNTITASGYGIALNDAKNCTITGNKITGSGYSSRDSLAKQKKYNGIHLGKESTGNTITNNTIKNVQQHGIFLQEGSSAVSLSENTVQKAGRNGINLYNKCQVTGNLSKNKVKNVKETGIMIDNQSKVSGKISGNTVDDAGKSGIYVLNQSKAGKGISGNRVSNIEENGISINNSATVNGGIQKNEISKVKKFSVCVMNKAGVFGSISGNTVCKADKPIAVINGGKAQIGKNTQK